MSIFITGGNGYLGSYVVDHLLRSTDEQLTLMIRAKDEAAADKKLYKGLQLHMGDREFWGFRDRISYVYGDLHAPDLGFDKKTQKKLTKKVDSVLHIAASLNRKSSKACLNTNLRGTLSVIKLAKRIEETNGLRRYSHVSTVAVAGQRKDEVVLEDKAIEWDRSDYDPYARTKKFCEHMARELLPEVPLCFFRPSIVMGDSRFAETTQFDMVRAFCLLADLKVVPLRSDVRLDIVNADYAGRAIAELHRKPTLAHDIYHLSSGTDSHTSGEIGSGLADALGRSPSRFVPTLETAFGGAVNSLAMMPGKNAVTFATALLKVFWPYITYNTVFDNQRVTEEMGEKPVPFLNYGAELYKFSKRENFKYPYRDLRDRPQPKAATSMPQEVRA